MSDNAVSTAHEHGEPDPQWIAPNGACALCARRNAEAQERLKWAANKRAEAAEKNAARYLWLKANHLQTGPDTWIRTGDDLEEAVDAGMKNASATPLGMEWETNDG